MTARGIDDFDADLIVVGAGGTGLMAALTAAEKGLRVLVLEKAAKVGGTSALSFGVFATSGTPHQAADGINDSSQAHFEDLNHFAGALVERDNLGLRRVLVETAPAAFRKLLDLGAVFTRPISETGHRVPRLHKMLPHSRAVTELVEQRCRRIGVRFRMNSEVTELVEADGRVSGVVLRDKTSLRARLGVLLTTGDFSNAPRAFKERYLASELVPIPGLNKLSTGDGQQLGLTLGGEVRNGDLVWGPEIRFVERPTPHPAIAAAFEPSPRPHHQAGARLPAAGHPQAIHDVVRDVLDAAIATALRDRRDFREPRRPPVRG